MEYFSGLFSKCKQILCVEQSKNCFKLFRLSHDKQEEPMLEVQ